MKKLLTSLLALLTCFACATAVACGESGNNSNGGNSNTGSNSDTGSIDEEDELQDAADYLEALYKEENLEMSRSYDVIPAVLGFPITWTVDVETGVTIKVEDNKVTVDIDASLEEDVTYVLTATLADGERTVSVSFTRVAKAVNAIPVAITKAPVAGTAYKYHLYQANLGKDLYFAGAMDGYYFATTETVEKTEESAGAVDVYVEYAEGSTTNFYLYFTDAANVKQYMSVEEAWNSKNSYWTFNVVFNPTVPVSTFVWSEQYQTVITTVASRSQDDNKNQSAEQTTTQTLYIGTYKTYDTFSASTVDKAATSFVGHLVEMIDKSTITPDVKVAEVKEGLALAKTDFVGAAEVELPVGRHADVTVAWACESEFVSIADGKLTITAPTAETTVTLTATLTCGEVSDTKEFTLTLKPAASLPAADSTLTIPQANELGVSLGGEYTEGKYYVSGVVSNVKNTQYGNLYIKDADGNEFYVYGVYSADGSARYDAMENAPQVGDTITVYGIIGSYSGSAQMKNGWMTAYTAGENGGTEEPPVTPPASGDYLADKVVTNPAVDTAYNLYMYQATAEKLVFLSGGMNGFYLATSEDAAAAVVCKLETADGGFYLYYLTGETKNYINIVTEMGTDGKEHTNAKIEATPSTVYTFNTEYNTLVGNGNFLGTRNDKTYLTVGPCAESYIETNFKVKLVAVEGEGGGTETPVDPPVVTPPVEGDAITTIAGALAGAEGDKATFSGTVSEIYQAWNTQYSNMSFYVTDGTNRILVFRAGTQVEIGDEVSVDGTITMYNEKPQIAQGATVAITAKHVCSTFTEADCLNAAKCTVCDKVNGEALGHTDENSDNVCDRCEGNLTAATVTVSKTMAELITANGWTTSTTKQSFNLDDVVSVKVNGGNNTGKAYNGDHIRIYATDSPAGTLTISVAEGYELVAIKISTQTGTYAFLYVDGTSTDICNVQTSVSGSSVVLNSVKNGSDGKQVRVTGIEVIYAPLN